MGLRETLNRNPAITTGVTIAIIIAALIWIFTMNFGGRPNVGVQTQSYFTTDDGATWFADDVQQLPPFQKDGKDAVRVYIFKCSDGKPFIAYLERYTPEAKRIITEARARQKANPQDMMAMEAQYSPQVQNGTEVKKPQDPGRWVQPVRDHMAYTKVVQINCPDGKTDSLEPVLP